MPDLVSIRDIRFSLSRERTGTLLGFVSFRLDRALIVDGVAVHQDEHGVIRLAFPLRKDRSGTQHSVVRPFDQAARDAITQQVAAALRGVGVVR